MRRPLVLLTLGMLITGCGGSDDAGPAEPAALAEDPGIVHVHGLGRNPTDGALFIATHTGLFRLAEGGSPLNSLAVHPRDGRHVLAAGSARSYVSADQGATWRPLPLPGGFVAWTESLGPVSVGLDGSVRRASEPLGEWRETARVDGEPAAVGSSGDELLVATHDGRVLASRNSGKRWVDLLAG
jgi:hypothetical protein